MGKKITEAHFRSGLQNETKQKKIKTEGKCQP